MRTRTWVGHSVLLDDLPSGPNNIFEDAGNVSLTWGGCFCTFVSSRASARRAGHIHPSPPSEAAVLGSSQSRVGWLESQARGWYGMPLGRLQRVWPGSELQERWPPGATLPPGCGYGARLLHRSWSDKEELNTVFACLSCSLNHWLSESVNVNILPLLQRRRCRRCCCCYYIPTANFPWAEFSMCAVLLLRSANSWLLSSLKQLQMFQLCSSMCMCFYCVATL